MNKQSLFWLMLLFCIPTFGQENTVAVLYGKYDSLRQAEGQDFMRIFLDKNGDFYPETEINENELMAANDNLYDWALQNPSSFIRVSQLYQLSFDVFSVSNFRLFQDSVIARNLYKLNLKSASYKSLNITVHGFRKPFRHRTVKHAPWSYNDSWSYEENELLRKKVNEITDSNFYVEVYWDGSYDCCIAFNTKKNKEIFQLFGEYSFISAVKTGYSLRQIISKVDHSEINIITHSAGATVASTLLFNTSKELVSDYYQSFSTPSQPKINICLIAPATSKELFLDYYNRNSELNFTQTDNYFLSIIYNKKDFALRKKDNFILLFGPGVKKFKNTALGCNYKGEVTALEKMFTQKYPNSSIQNYGIRPIMKHYLTVYIETEEFVEWLKKK